MNTFYVYKIGVLACVKITKTLRAKRVFNLNNASFWVSKRDAKSWEYAIKKKFPNAVLTECELKFKK